MHSPVFPTPLIEYTAFTALYVPASFVKYELTVKAQVYFWVLYSVPLISISVYMLVLCCFDYYDLVVQFVIGQHDSSNFVLLSQDCCGYLRSFVVPYKFLKYFFYFCEICHWYLDRNSIESINCLGQYGDFFKIFYLFIFREGKGRRKRGWEISMCGCLSCAPYWGPGLCPDWESNR